MGNWAKARFFFFCHVRRPYCQCPKMNSDNLVDESHYYTSTSANLTVTDNKHTPPAAFKWTEVALTAQDSLFSCGILCEILLTPWFRVASWSQSTIYDRGVSGMFKKVNMLIILTVLDLWWKKIATKLCWIEITFSLFWLCHIMYNGHTLLSTCCKLAHSDSTVKLHHRSHGTSWF